MINADPAAVDGAVLLAVPVVDAQDLRVLRHRQLLPYLQADWRGWLVQQAS